MTVTADYRVAGMNCGHCVHAVTKEIAALDGVEAVSVDLDPDGPSTVHVTSSAPLADSAVAAAVDEAGYTLVGAV